MTSWDYRVLEKKMPDGTSMLGIHEVHYAADGSICDWTIAPVRLVGESLDEVRQALGAALRGAKLPVLKLT